MTEAAWPRIAVFGAGGVGCYFGGMLARAGAPVTLIGRGTHVDAMARDGLLLESMTFTERVPLSASSDPAAVAGATVVFLSVKTLDTVTAAQAIAPHLDPGATLVTLQNGVDNVDRIREAVGLDAIPAVVYVAAEMVAAGHVKHTGLGKLVIGELPGYQGSRPLHDPIPMLAAMMKRATVPCQTTDNIRGDLWVKMIMNSSHNAVSALCRARYGPLSRHDGTRWILSAVVAEALAVAAADGVRLPDVDVHHAALTLGELMNDAISSTAQDIGRGKKTEIDSFNGYLAARGAALGIPTPVNRTLFGLVKLLEEAS